MVGRDDDVRCAGQQASVAGVRVRKLLLLPLGTGNGFVPEDGIGGSPTEFSSFP
jgi:hypothetical protein